MSQTSEGARVSVIGLGNMGSALAEALLAKDLSVTVWNRTASKGAALAASGAAVAASAAEAAAAADLLVVCVTNHVASLSDFKATAWPRPCGASCWCNSAP